MGKYTRKTLGNTQVFVNRVLGFTPGIRKYRSILAFVERALGLTPGMGKYTRKNLREYTSSLV